MVKRKEVYWKEHPMKTKSGKIVTRKGHTKNLREIDPHKVGIISREELSQSQLVRGSVLRDDSPVEGIAGIGTVMSQELHDRNIDTIEDFKRFKESFKGYDENLNQRREIIQRNIDDIREKIDDIDKEVDKYYSGGFYEGIGKEEIKKEKKRLKEVKLKSYEEELDHLQCQYNYPYLSLAYPQSPEDIKGLQEKNYPIRPGREYEDLLWQFPSWMVSNVKFQYITEKQRSHMGRNVGSIKYQCGAAYNPSTDAILLPEGNFKDDKIKLYHEFAHHVWHKQMNMRAWNDWETISVKLKKTPIPTPGGYDEVSRIISHVQNPSQVSQEWFADTFAHYIDNRFDTIREKVIGSKHVVGLEYYSRDLDKWEGKMRKLEYQKSQQGIAKKDYSKSKEYRKIKKNTHKIERRLRVFNRQLSVINELERYYDRLMEQKGHIYYK